MSQAAVACPFCGSDDVELVSPWAGQIITSQLRCRGCNAYFEAVREEFAPRTDPDQPSWTTS
jgi:C4-type Zn-finger protein